MKVLFFSNHLSGGDGWSTNSLNTILPLQKEGVECVVIVNEKIKGMGIKQYAGLKRPLQYLYNPFLILLDIFKIRRIVKREKPDVVHFLVEPYALFLPFLNKKYYTKSVLTICGTYSIVPLKKMRVAFLSRLYYRFLDKVISISNYTADRLKEVLPTVADKIEVVHCGIDTSLLVKSPKGDSVKKSIVFVGYLKERKGIMEALHAINAYKEKYDDNFIFSVAGGYDKRERYIKEIKDYITAHGLEKNVDLLGMVSEEQKEELLSKADLFIMLSKVCGDYFEGFGLVYLEANKYGVPAIAPRESGAAEALKNGYSGYTVDIFNAQEVADKISLILDQQSIQKNNCLAWAQEHDMNKVAGRISNVYKKLLIHKKVLFFTNNLSGKCGWSRYSLDLISGVRERGSDILCLVNETTDNYKVRQIAVLSKPTLYIYMPFLILLDIFKIRRIVKKEKPDVVHFLVEPYALFLPLLGRIVRHSVITVHGTYAVLPLIKWQTKFLARRYYRKISRVISVSEHTKGKLCRLVPKFKDKILVVRNGVSVEREDHHSRVKDPGGQKNIVFIGLVHERKGLLEAVKALARYKNKYGTDFKFLIAGKYDSAGEYYKQLKNSISRHGLENNISLLGLVSEEKKKEILCQADLFLMLSVEKFQEFEGFGLVYLEANKYGVPVIGPNKGGPVEAIKDGYSGYQVNVDDEDQVADRIFSVLDENKINSQDCIAWVRDNDVSKTVDQTLQVYEQI